MSLLVVLDGALGDVCLRLPTLAAITRQRGAPVVLAPGRWCGLLQDRGLAEAAWRVDAAAWLSLRARAPRWPAGLPEVQEALILHDDPDLAAGLRSLGVAVTEVSGTPPEGQHQALHAWEGARRLHGQPLPAGPEALAPPLADPGVKRGAHVLLLPGSGGVSKCWPPERYEALAQTLMRAGRAVEVMLGPVELERGFGERAWGGAPVRACSELEETRARLGAAGLVIGNDAGTSHLAAAAGAPTLTLFGPTSAARWRPIGPRAQVLGAGALSALSVGVVRDAALAYQVQIQSLPEQPRG